MASLASKGDIVAQTKCLGLGMAGVDEEPSCPARSVLTAARPGPSQQWVNGLPASAGVGWRNAAELPVCFAGATISHQKLLWTQKLEREGQFLDLRS